MARKAYVAIGIVFGTVILAIVGLRYSDWQDARQKLRSYEQAVAAYREARSLSPFVLNEEEKADLGMACEVLRLKAQRIYAGMRDDVQSRVDPELAAITEGERPFSAGAEYEEIILDLYQTLRPTLLKRRDDSRTRKKPSSASVFFLFRRSALSRAVKSKELTRVSS